MHGVKGFVVGIESQGDPLPRLQESLETFAEANCKIIFCGCRTSGKTVHWVNALSSRYSVHFVPQTRAAESHEAANAATVSSLMLQAGI